MATKSSATKKTGTSTPAKKSNTNSTAKKKVEDKEKKTVSTNKKVVATAKKSNASSSDKKAISSPKKATTSTSKTTTKSSTPSAKKPSTTSKKVTATSTKKTAANAQKIPAKKGAAKDLKDLFVDAMKDIYWAEKALTKALPKMHKNATDEKLKKAIEAHMAETNTHVKRLEENFKSLKLKAQAKKCDAMQGLLDEGEGIMEETSPGAVRDAGIIAASQKIEHYEIASYGTLAAYAKVLDEKTSLKNLLDTLKEEKNCDELLSKIADTTLNTKAK